MWKTQSFQQVSGPAALLPSKAVETQAGLHNFPYILHFLLLRPLSESVAMGRKSVKKLQICKKSMTGQGQNLDEENFFVKTAQILPSNGNGGNLRWG